MSGPGDGAEGDRDLDRERIKQEFIARRGYWRPWVDTMLDTSPGFVEQYARYAGYPADSGPLSARMVELIYVGLDSSSSHLFAAGLRTHMQKALEVGATAADIVDVLHLVAVQGAAGVCQAADILAECAGLEGRAVPDVALRRRMDEVGAAHALALESVARLDPGYVEVLLDFVEKGRGGGGLTSAERTLVQLAMHACFTALNPQAVRMLVTTGLAQGVAVGALLQAIQLGGHLAVHGTALGVGVWAGG